MLQMEVYVVHTSCCSPALLQDPRSPPISLISNHWSSFGLGISSSGKITCRLTCCYPPKHLSTPCPDMHPDMHLRAPCDHKLTEQDERVTNVTQQCKSSLKPCVLQTSQFRDRMYSMLHSSKVFNSKSWHTQPLSNL
jgi:hypothetical protein